MTENEAIKQLQVGYLGDTEDLVQAKHIAIKALEEIQQYRAIGTIEEFKALKEKNNEHYSDTDELDGYGYTCTNKTCVERIRNKAIDEFAELMKEKLKDMQFAEFQGIDVCPCAKTGEECPYINQDIGCQYCAREQTIKDIDEIAERLKVGGENG